MLITNHLTCGRREDVAHYGKGEKKQEKGVRKKASEKCAFLDKDLIRLV